MIYCTKHCKHGRCSYVATHDRIISKAVTFYNIYMHIGTHKAPITFVWRQSQPFSVGEFPRNTFSTANE